MSKGKQIILSNLSLVTLTSNSLLSVIQNVPYIMSFNKIYYQIPSKITTFHNNNFSVRRP